MSTKKSQGRGQGLWAAAAGLPGYRRLRLAGPLTCLPVILVLALWRHSVTQQLAQRLQGAGSEAFPNGGTGSGSGQSTPVLFMASDAQPGKDGSGASPAGCTAGYYCPAHSYPNVAAAELLPFLLRRRAQTQLERRWGAPPVLSPRPLPQGRTMRIPRILHHGGLLDLGCSCLISHDALGGSCTTPGSHLTCPLFILIPSAHAWPCPALLCLLCLLLNRCTLPA